MRDDNDNDDNDVHDYRSLIHHHAVQTTSHDHSLFPHRRDTAEYHLTKPTCNIQCSTLNPNFPTVSVVTLISSPDLTSRTSKPHGETVRDVTDESNALCVYTSLSDAQWGGEYGTDIRHVGVCPEDVVDAINGDTPKRQLPIQSDDTTSSRSVRYTHISMNHVICWARFLNPSHVHALCLTD